MATFDSFVVAFVVSSLNTFRFAFDVGTAARVRAAQARPVALGSTSNNTDT